MKDDYQQFGYDTEPYRETRLHLKLEKFLPRSIMLRNQHLQSLSMPDGHRHLGARVSLDKVDKKLRLRAVRKLDWLALRAISDVLSPDCY